MRNRDFLAWRHEVFRARPPTLSGVLFRGLRSYPNLGQGSPSSVPSPTGIGGGRSLNGHQEVQAPS